MDFLRSIFAPKVPIGVNLISWATAIRWSGWGFVDALIPIFLFSFVGTYAKAGLLKSVFDIVFLLALPLVGYIANKVPNKYIILVGLLIYPFIGLSYFFAGALGMILFIIIARVLNGVSLALDSVGRITYIRKHTPREHIATAFGYFETLTGFWWILAVFASLILIRFFAIHELFLAIIPTTLIAFLIILKIPKDKKDNNQNHWKKYLSLKSYGKLIKEIRLWSRNLKQLAVISFFSGFIFIFPIFFLPIYIYSQGGSLQQVILLVAISAIPRLFGSPLGILADKIGKKVIPFSFFIITILLVWLSLTDIYTFQHIIILFLSLFGLMIRLSSGSETTLAGDPTHYGSLTSAFTEIGQMSAIIGPIAVGFSMDSIGIKITILILAFIALGLTLFSKIKLKSERFKIPS